MKMHRLFGLVRTRKKRPGPRTRAPAHALLQTLDGWVRMAQDVELVAVCSRTLSNAQEVYYVVAQHS